MACDVKHEPLSMTSFFTCRLYKCCTRQWSSFAMTASVLRDCRSKTHDLPVHESMMPRKYSVSLRSATEHTFDVHEAAIEWVGLFCPADSRCRCVFDFTV